jgi:serine/threonine protein kinase/Tol biopolymer transport system component
MTPERWQQIRDVLEQALSLAADQRHALLDRACASDSDLRKEVETLLASSDDVRSSFLESLPPRVALTPGARLGEYQIKSMLGAGGMGEVYCARDSRLGRDVAIKVLPALLSTDADRLRRFEQEARAAAALNHPNILAVHQMGTFEGSPYLVSELLEGETLREQLKRGRITVRKAIDYGVQIARGLSAAHEKGIVHRDLKPENLFVTKDGRVKILDFGLAKLVQPGAGSEHSVPTAGGETQPGAVMGTVGYMSPEQVRGLNVDHRTDIFSFGTTLYEMLTGQRAFHKPTLADTMSAILNEDPPPISQVTANIPPALQRVVHRCLEKTPEQRFQSASDLAFAMDALSEGWGSGSAGHGLSSTRVATPSGVFIPPSVASVRNWAAVVLTALVLVGVGLAWFLWKRGSSASAQIAQRQLTASAADNPIQNAIISRDGKYLAYKDNDGISIEEIDNGDVHRLPNTEGLVLQDWYVDGLHLLVNDDDHNLWSFFAFSGEKHKLASRIITAHMSPDGSEIMLLRSMLPSEIWTMPTAGGEPLVRISLGPDEVFLAADWSPDGAAIVDISSPKDLNTGKLEIRSLADGKTHILLTDKALLGGGLNTVSWLPDSRILFGLFKGLVGDPSESDLWALSLDSSGAPLGKPARITNTIGFQVGEPSISRDGKRLAVVVQRNPICIHVARLSKKSDALEQIRRLTNDTNWPVAWSLAGDSLYYFSSSSHSLYKRHLSPDSTELFSSGQDFYGRGSPTPDGAWLMVMARTGDKRSLLRIPVTGGAPETVLTPQRGLAEIRCASFGSRICVLSEIIGKQLIFSAVDPLRGRLETLAGTDHAHPEELRWNLSPDGTRIAMVQNLSENVHVLDLKSKRTREIHLIPPQTDLQQAAWSADAQRLFVSSGKGLLLEMDLDGRTRVLENSNGWIGSPLPSPEGKRIAYNYEATEANVILVEHF